jgi:hypothetical protein
MPIDNMTPPTPEEINNPDFQAVLKELLKVYQPILEEDLKRAQEPEALKREAQEKPPSCDDELALADRLFENFVTEDVARHLLPAQARDLLGPAERWRWCLRHIRCCIIFGWLACRGQRSFRAFVYYLYRYWLCVRQVLGNPVSTPPTDEQRQDFQTLVHSLADAYKPFLTDQLATVEFTAGLPEEVLEGKVDCFEGDEAAAAVFDRLLNANTAQALLGRQAFEQHSKEPFFLFCRCWCICAIRFGCCLARARNLVDVLRCLVFYFRCLRDCFRPLTCELLKPAMNACAAEQFIPGPNVLGVEIIGTAAGAFCTHYVLEWKPAGAPDSAYSSAGIVYPGGAATGPCGVVNGTLGYLTTTAGPVPDNVTVRVCVFGQNAPAQCCTVDFEIFRQRVWITGLEGVLVESPPGVLAPTAQLKTGGVVRSFGTALQIHGRAWVGKCTGREIKRYTLAYQSGFLVDPTAGAWTQFWQVDYDTPLQRKEIQTGEFPLTSFWHSAPICLPSPPFPPGTCFPKDWLLGTRWRSGRNLPSVPVAPQSFPVDPQVPATIWVSQQLPLAINCQSGKYTIRVEVEDTMGDHYYDLQQVWFDNKEIHGKISQLAGVPACDSIDLSKFALSGGDCSVPWPADLLGIAYDEYIEETNLSVPSDNFGGYSLWIKKDGAPDPGVPLPLPGPGSPPWGPPFVSTSRVGDPGTRCPTAAPPPAFVPAETPGTLATLDLRRLDAVCNPAEPALTLKRGDCCGYVLRLLVWDTSVCPSLSGGRHQIAHHFPICICNDLPPTEQ